MNANKISILVTLSFCLYSLTRGQDIDIEVFKNLSEINQKWLRFTSIPEVARLLQLPPYSYHSNKFISGALNLSELYDVNESLTPDGGYVEEGHQCSDDVVQMLSNLDSSWALQSKCFLFYFFS